MIICVWRETELYIQNEYLVHHAKDILFQFLQVVEQYEDDQMLF